MQIRWVAVGLIALALGCSHMHEGKKESEEGEEKNEVKMSINDVPAAARDALMREANGASITTVDKEERHGKTIYETDVMSGGKNWEIKVDGNGKLISKRIEKDEDEKAEKEEKEEKK